MSNRILALPGTPQRESIEKASKVSPFQRPINVHAIRRWETLLDQLDHPAMELDVETMAPVIATFNYLHRAGIRFERGLVIIMKHLQRQMMQSESCVEDSDDAVEADESSESVCDAVERDEAVER